MTARKVKVPFQGRVVEGTEVPVEESNERWSDISLQDGARFRLKSSVVSAVRLDEYDAQGNPIYVLNATPVMVIAEMPDALKRKPN